MSERFYVDERVGCIGVRDRTEDASREDEPGLDTDTTGLVKLWFGVHRTKQCPHCHSTVDGGYDISDVVKIRAKRLAVTLNEECQDMTYQEIIDGPKLLP